MCRPGLARAADSVLLVVDAQTRLLDVMAGSPLPRIILLSRVAALLQVPILVTRQSPDALGDLAPELRAVLPTATPVFDKTYFSCAQVPRLRAYLDACGRNQVILVGVEAHVCVLQTAFELTAQGCEILTVTDAVASRDEADRACAVARMQAAAVTPIRSESVAFEWLRDAAHPKFREILGLVK